MSETFVPQIQRALILQGEGVLGAYEAGVFNAFYEAIKDIDKQEGVSGESIFGKLC